MKHIGILVVVALVAYFLGIYYPSYGQKAASFVGVGV